jgi:hypothetical protein
MGLPASPLWKKHHLAHLAKAEADFVLFKRHRRVPSYHVNINSHGFLAIHIHAVNKCSLQMPVLAQLNAEV